MMAERFLLNILDVPGVTGLCLSNHAGESLMVRLPEYLPEELVLDLQRRSQALFSTLDENYQPSDEYLLRFQGHMVLLRRTETVVLVLLLTNTANLMSVRMVLNLAVRHLNAATVAGMKPHVLRSTAPAPRPKAVAEIPAPPPLVAAMVELPTSLATPAPIPPPPAEAVAEPTAALVADASRRGEKLERPKSQRLYRGQAF